MYGGNSNEQGIDSNWKKYFFKHYVILIHLLFWKWFRKVNLILINITNCLIQSRKCFCYGYPGIRFQWWFEFVFHYLQIINKQKYQTAYQQFINYLHVKREWNNCDLLMYSLSSVEEMRLEKTLFNVYQFRCRLSNRRKLTTCILILWQIKKLSDL